MKKKLLIVLLVVLVLALSLFLVACNDGSNDDNDNGTTGDNGDNSGDNTDEPIIENLNDKLNFEKDLFYDFYVVSAKEGAVLDGKLIIPSSHKGLPVKKVAAYAFPKTGVTSIVFPNTITEVDDFAFSECENLTKVTFEEGSALEAMGDYMFKNCTKLTSVDMPNSIKEIGEGTFSYCESLKNITLPSSLEIINKYAFQRCILESIEMPNTVTEIGQDAFSNCEAMASVTLSNSLTKIGASAFSSTYSLESIVLPSSLVEIGRGAFAVSGLKEITIPKSVTTMGDSIFYRAESLTKINCEITEEEKPETWSEYWDILYGDQDYQTGEWSGVQRHSQIVWGN